VRVSRAAAVRLLALALAFPLAMTLASPLIAIVIHRQGVTHYATHYRLVAQAVERAWRASTDQPLRLVGSYTNLVNGMAFYFAERPSTFEIETPHHTPWADAARIAREGIALACPAAEARCLRPMAALAARAPSARRSEVEIARSHLGVADTPVRYVIVVIPPER